MAEWCIMKLINAGLFYVSVFYLLYSMYNGATTENINHQFIYMTIIGFLTLINQK